MLSVNYLLPLPACSSILNWLTEPSADMCGTPVPGEWQVIVFRQNNDPVQT